MAYTTDATTTQRLLAAISETNAIHKILGVLVALLIFHQLFSSKPKAGVPLFPTWSPIEIALTSHIVGAGGIGRRIYSALRRYDGSLFGLTSKHQILYDLPTVERFFSQGSHTIDLGPLQWTMLKRIFGADTGPELSSKYNQRVSKDLTTPIERVFVNEAASTASIQKGDVPGKAASFISFTSRLEDMRLWERAAGIRVITPEAPGQAGAVEAELHSIMRDFGACVAIPLLYGQDFLDRNPTVLADFWTFDNDLFPLLMVGVPKWLPLKVMKDGLAARARVLDALEGLSKRIDQHENDLPVDFNADMSDVSSVALERNKVFAKNGIGIRHRGEIESTVLWGQNANTQPLIFWFIAYIYSMPGLLANLRKEIAPFVPVSSTLPPTIVSMDLPGLSRDCPLLKATIFEAMRLCNDPTSIRYIARDVELRDGQITHHLPAGSWVSAPHGVIQKDAAVFDDPHMFVPERFLEEDPQTGRKTARYGRLKPWGVGIGICKGRTFAEKEIIAIGATIMTLWDMEPASSDGEWKIPAMRPGTGICKPAEELRVVIKRRIMP